VTQSRDEADQQRSDLLGAIIRKQRQLAELPLRQVAAAVGISYPYLSQIERGLRAPSEAVLEGIARTLATTSDALYEETGLLRASSADPDVVCSIEAAKELTAGQRRALREMYDAFVVANEARRHSRSGKK
jgi:transcriptional regulator with XRE-family HTH domain